MKILFALTVFTASIYLFIQQKGLEKLSQYLPQHQIEQNAETLLASVNQNVSENINHSLDEKLKQFKIKLANQKEHRINELEKQLADLQGKFDKRESQVTNINHENTSQENIPLNETIEPTQQNFSSEPAFAKTQYLSGGSSTTETSMNFDNSEKQKVIRRQANLQDIAERMNKTSLLALTQ